MFAFSVAPVYTMPCTLVTPKEQEPQRGALNMYCTVALPSRVTPQPSFDYREMALPRSPVKFYFRSVRLFSSSSALK